MIPLSALHRSIQLDHDLLSSLQKEWFQRQKLVSSYKEKAYCQGNVNMLTMALQMLDRYLELLSVIKDKEES